MPEFTQKYTLVKLLESMTEGTEYNSADWPLHVTIVDTFAVEWEESDLLDKLSGLLDTKRKIATATAIHDDYFGCQKQTQVTILNMSKELVALHYDAVSLLRSAGAIFNDPQYIEEGYRAHVTAQPHARLSQGDFIKIDDICRAPALLSKETAS